MKINYARVIHLRTSLFTKPFIIGDGSLFLSDTPGIGWELDSESMEKWVVAHS